MSILLYKSDKTKSPVYCLIFWMLSPGLKQWALAGYTPPERHNGTG